MVRHYRVTGIVNSEAIARARVVRMYAFFRRFGIWADFFPV